MIGSLLRAMRPRHWVKNLFVLPALVFSKHAFEWSYLQRSIAGMLCFWALSCAVYLLNDVCDVEQDRQHPQKAARPVAAGEVGSLMALSISGILFVAGLAAAFQLGLEFGCVALAYGGINFFYSVLLKHFALVDVMLVATGFLLRAVGGAVVIAVEISPWFVLCSFTLPLCQAVVKRRQEICLHGGGDMENHRPTLGQYSVFFLDQVATILVSATLVFYALYAMGVGEGNPAHMQWTIPFVVYGLLRYLFLVHEHKQGGDPTEMLWQDRPLQACLVLWLVASFLALYVPY